MTEKLCPLNQMKPCIGKKCAMYIDIVSTPTTTIEGETLAINNDTKKIFNPPCALTVSAYSSFCLYSYKSAKDEFQHYLTKQK